MIYDPETFYASLNAHIPIWAAARDDLRAVVQVGSRARRDHPGDRYADADYLVVIRDPALYLADTAWTADFGVVVNLIHAKTAGGEDELLVLYTGGYTVDFVFPPAPAIQQAIEQKIPVLILQRGARILVDKDGQAAQLIALQDRPVPPVPLPSENDFQEDARLFWYIVVYAAKQIKRNDLLTLMLRCNELERLAVKLIENHTRAACGPQRDTWHMGRFLEEWADPRAVQSLPSIFPPYERAGAWRALRAVMDLYSWLGRETAEKLGYAYPHKLEQDVLAAITALEADPL